MESSVKYLSARKPTEAEAAIRRFEASCRMVAEEKINPDFVRSDGTVVGTDIHWPTDSRL